MKLSMTSQSLRTCRFVEKQITLSLMIVDSKMSEI